MISKEKIKKYYLDNNYEGLEKEILSNNLSEKEVNEILEYITEIKDKEKPKVVKMFKDLFKDDINGLFIIEEKQEEITDDFKLEIATSLKKIQRIKEIVFEILQNQEVLSATNPEKFYDLAILLEQEIFTMNKYISFISVKHYRRIIDLMAQYNCSRIQAENRAMAEKSYLNYKQQLLDMKALDELILLLKKRGQVV